ncbi:hypothetical protein ZEAMMB73_Zm00001d046987 [Zea mays]|uniref:Uncharacterized protein n=2 Tax=Zea mays TaxID=4577 RepID=A0A1D6P5T6_MAIZE|nr:hypothetical protein ZEAMMB73_Zm00001d046987 [Zea mays]
MATSVERHLPPTRGRPLCLPRASTCSAPVAQEASIAPAPILIPWKNTTFPPDWRSSYLLCLEVEPAVCDSRGEATSDAWVQRHPALVRLTGKHPFNLEPLVSWLMAHDFITPAPHHYHY